MNSGPRALSPSRVLLKGVLRTTYGETLSCVLFPQILKEILRVSVEVIGFIWCLVQLVPSTLGKILLGVFLG